MAMTNRNMLRKRGKMFNGHCPYRINVCLQRKLDKEIVMHVLVVVVVVVVVVVLVVVFYYKVASCWLFLLSIGGIA
jgi:hypothetical protein